MPEKKCTKCGEVKNLTQFYGWTDKHTLQQKYQAWCKECMAEHQMAKHAKQTKGIKLETTPLNIGHVPRKFRDFLANEPFGPFEKTCLFPGCIDAAIPGDTTVVNLTGPDEIAHVCLCITHWYVVESPSFSLD